MLFVDCHALGLAERALVPVKPKPLHAVEDDLDGLIGGTGLVRVLDPEDELSAVVAGEEPVEERGAYAANVQSAGRAWCKTDTNITGSAHEEMDSF